jgi:hypothetical protein
MSNPAPTSKKTHDQISDTHQSISEIRDQCNQYFAHMVDLVLEGQKENMRLLSQIQKSMLKNGKNLSESISQNGNGYASSHQTSSNDFLKSFMDITALMLDSAHLTAEKSANIAKSSIANHTGKTQSVQQHGKH